MSVMNVQSGVVLKDVFEKEEVQAEADKVLKNILSKDPELAQAGPAQDKIANLININETTDKTFMTALKPG